MTRKHYRQLAAILNRHWLAELLTADIGAPLVVEDLARELCDVFKQDNRAFSSQRFMDAVTADADTGHLRAKDGNNDKTRQ